MQGIWYSQVQGADKMFRLNLNIWTSLHFQGAAYYPNPNFINSARGFKCARCKLHVLGRFYQTLLERLLIIHKNMTVNQTCNAGTTGYENTSQSLGHQGNPSNTTFIFYSSCNDLSIIQLVDQHKIKTFSTKTPNILWFVTSPLYIIVNWISLILYCWSCKASHLNAFL